MSKQSLRQTLLDIRDNKTGTIRKDRPMFLFSGDAWNPDELANAISSLWDGQVFTKKIHCMYGTLNEYMAWEKQHYDNATIPEEDLPIDLGCLTLTFTLLFRDNIRNMQLSMAVDYFNGRQWSRKLPTHFRIERNLREMTKSATRMVQNTYRSYVIYNLLEE